MYLSPLVNNRVFPAVTRRIDVSSVRTQPAIRTAIWTVKNLDSQDGYPTGGVLPIPKNSAELYNHLICQQSFRREQIFYSHSQKSIGINAK